MLLLNNQLWIKSHYLEVLEQIARSEGVAPTDGSTLIAAARRQAEADLMFVSGFLTLEGGATTMRVRKQLKALIHGMMQWLDEGDKDPSPEVPSTDTSSVPFDNSYPWLVTNFVKLMQDPICSRRPQYIYGVLQGAALAKVLGVPQISVLEFGVGSGAGLLALERIAERSEGLVGIGIDVYGFDTGTGMPKPQDYRDCPQKMLEGYYPVDQDELATRLRRAHLKLGLVKDTVEAFIQSNPPLMAFVAFDLVMYSSTKDAFRLFDADDALLLPRTPCSFRSAIGKDYCEYTGELLAISEFNSAHVMRKLQAIRTLYLFFPYPFNCMWWIEMMYTFHSFNHPLYNSPESLRQPAIIDIDGNEIYESVPK